MPAALPFVALGLGLFGTVMQVSAAQKQSEYQQQMIEQQQRAEAVRKRQMELDAQRRQMEMIRQQQRARSMSLTNATGAGAQFGSGLQGGYGQLAGMTGTNLLGVTQNLEFGQQLFGINAQIGQAQIGMAQAGAQSAFGKGLSSLGGSMIGFQPQLTALMTPGVSMPRMTNYPGYTSYMENSGNPFSR